VLIQDTGNAIVVAFRGTKSLLNFVTDGDAFRDKKSFRGQPYEVHRGFQKASDAVALQVDSEISRLCGSRARPVMVTGHSLGGAHAKLYALHSQLVVTGGWIHSVYTFGEPRSTDKAGAFICQSLFGERHFRFEDDLDCVTRIPGWLIGYRHSGHDVFLPSTGGYLLDPVLWVKAISDAWAIYSSRRLGPLALMELLDDHHQSKYVSKVNQLT
jgi:triacylglycerol lipase